MKHQLEPIHPGEVLDEEFVQPLGITQYRLAKETSVPARRINEIVRRRRGITADTALRLAKFFGTSEMFWLNLQARYDLDMQRRKMGAGLALVRPFVRPRAEGAAPQKSKVTTEPSATITPTNPRRHAPRDGHDDVHRCCPPPTVPQGGVGGEAPRIPVAVPS